MSAQKETTMQFDAIMKAASGPAIIAIVIYFGWMLFITEPTERKEHEVSLQAQRTAYIAQLKEKDEWYTKIIREHNEIFEKQLENVQSRCFDAVKENRDLLIIHNKEIGDIAKKLGVRENKE